MNSMQFMPQLSKFPIHFIEFPYQRNRRASISFATARRRHRKGRHRPPRRRHQLEQSHSCRHSSRALIIEMSDALRLFKNCLNIPRCHNA